MLFRFQIFVFRDMVSSASFLARKGKTLPCAVLAIVELINKAAVSFCPYVK